MAVKKGDLIKASEYNNYVMGLPYVDKFVDSRTTQFWHSSPSRTTTKYIWMRGSRTDSGGTPLPAPYPGYNSFHIHVNNDYAYGSNVYVHIGRVTWDTGGNEVVTPVSGSPFTDVGPESSGTHYYRLFEPGYYKVEIVLGHVNWIVVGAINQSAFVEFKPWQNQVKDGEHLRVFADDRSDLVTLGYGAEFKAEDAHKGLYGDGLFMGGTQGG